MNADVWFQGLAWLAAAWLLTEEVLVRRGRTPGVSHRAAAATAAIAAVLLAVRAQLWPVAAIGLLWLRAGAFPRGTLPHRPGGVHLPHLEPRQQRLIFRVELVVVAVVIAIMLSGWVGDQLDLFNRRADTTVCRVAVSSC